MLFDRLNQHCLFSITLFITAIATAAAPWCHRFVFLVAIVAFQGISMGFLDTGTIHKFVIICKIWFEGGNVLCLQVWGRNNGPAMQAMHFAFGLGAFISPLLAEPFLSIVSPQVTTPSILNHSRYTASIIPPTTTHHRSNRDVMHDIHPAGDTLLSRSSRDASEKQKPLSNGGLLDDKGAGGQQVQKKLRDNQEKEKAEKLTSTMKPNAITRKSTVKTDVPTTATQRSTTTIDNISTNKTNMTKPDTNDQTESTAHKIVHTIKNMSKIQFAYLTVAVLLLLVAILFMVMCCRWQRHLTAAINEPFEASHLFREESYGFCVQLLCLLFFFYFLYLGMESTYSGLVSTFSVKKLGWKQEKGALLTSLFWGTFATGRGVAIILARYMKPAALLVIDLILTCVALVTLLMAADKQPMVMWVGTALLGLGMSSVFPTGITWAERYMRVTGKVN